MTFDKYIWYVWRGALVERLALSIIINIGSWPIRLMEGHLARQSVALILFGRRFHKASSVALDILSHILSEITQALWQRCKRLSELVGCNKVTFALAGEELLKSARTIYVSLEELRAFEAEYGAEGASIWGDRVLPVLWLPGRVDQRLLVLDETKPDNNT